MVDYLCLLLVGDGVKRRPELITGGRDAGEARGSFE
jgi:hypothetical protein